MEDEIFQYGTVPWGCDQCFESAVIGAKIMIKGTWHLLAVTAAAAGPQLCPDAVLHTILRDSFDYHDLKGLAFFCKACEALFAGKASKKAEDAAQSAAQVPHLCSSFQLKFLIS